MHYLTGTHITHFRMCLIPCTQEHKATQKHKYWLFASYRVISSEFIASLKCCEIISKHQPQFFWTICWNECQRMLSFVSKHPTIIGHQCNFWPNVIERHIEYWILLPASLSVILQDNLIWALSNFEIVGRVDVLHEWKEMSKALLDDKACERRGELATLHLAFLFQAAVHRACIGNLDLSSHGAR